MDVINETYNQLILSKGKLFNNLERGSAWSEQLKGLKREAEGSLS